MALLPSWYMTNRLPWPSITAGPLRMGKKEFGWGQVSVKKWFPPWSTLLMAPAPPIQRPIGEAGPVVVPLVPLCVPALVADSALPVAAPVLVPVAAPVASAPVPEPPELISELIGLPP